MGRALILAWLAALTTGGCSKAEPEGAPRYRLPWPVTKGVYEPREIEIRTLNRPEALEGSVARILIDPFILGGLLQSSVPVARFVRTKEGVKVPSDFTTLQAVTLYAHLERLQDLDASMGIQGAIKWPVQVGLQANILDQRGAVENNALFDSRLDALLVVPYVASHLPISMNAGIIAHEHFHRIFQSLILNRIADQSALVGKPSLLSGNRSNAVCNWSHGSHGSNGSNGSLASTTALHSERASVATKPARTTRAGVFVKITHSNEDLSSAERVPRLVYYSYLLRAFNEGLADFWGWVYSGDSSFIGVSLGQQESGPRRMDLGAGRLPSEKTIRLTLIDPKQEDGLRDEAGRVQLAYMLGSQFARFLRELALDASGGEDRALDQRVAVARALVDAMPEIADKLISEINVSYISPDSLVLPILEKLPSITLKTCEIFESFSSEGLDSTDFSKCLNLRSTATTKVVKDRK